MKQRLLLAVLILFSLQSILGQVANQPTNLLTCERNGYVEFDLRSMDRLILGSQSSDLYELTYYESLADAESGGSSLDTYFYTYANGFPITFYARVEDINTGNFATTFFDVEVIQTYFDLKNTEAIKCDDNIADGITAFTKSNFIYYAGDTVHRTQADANTGANALPSTFYNIKPYQDKVYGRSQNEYGCYETATIDLYVNINPIIQTPTPLSTCDDDLDGFVEFDLISKKNEILNGITDATITYHLNYSDSTSFNYKNQKIPELFTNTVANKQIVYIRATNNNGCYVITSLDLVVQDCRDQDDDGIINSDEDINGNGNLDDDDTDNDGIPNYMDDDDDGDKIDTIDELIDQNAITSKISKSSKTTRIFLDTDSDTIENYLDDDDDGDGILTKDEDYNNNGTPLDDDTNDNNVPDYLEKEVALSNSNFEFIDFSIFPNPTNHFVEIKFSKTTNNRVQLGIYNIQGKLILNEERELQNNTTKLDISNLKSGMYFLKVNDGVAEMTQKLIVN